MNRLLLILLICAARLPHADAVFQTETDETSGSKPEDVEFFERRIRPLLSEHCYACHSSRAKTVHGGLRLDAAAHLTAGGDSGPVVVPGDPDGSLLVQSVRYTGDIHMPPKGKLPPEKIALLTEWVQRGAPFPNAPEELKPVDRAIDFAAGKTFWSFQPVVEKPLPSVKQQNWAQQRIDTFVLAAMEAQGLQPAMEADRRTLIRRLYFDVVGLPPTPEQVRQFVDDPSPGAWEELVDRLLKSEQYGERWARVWLDVARYADKTESWLYSGGEPHLYRDWVVKAFNDDMPYNDFVRRQIATDLMPETGPEDLPALGFVGLSPTYWKELQLPCEIIKVIVADEWEAQVDAVSRSFLGLTVACARCHDHKFDPINSEDYYALAGIFASIRQIERPTISDELYEPVRQAKASVENLQKELDQLKKDQTQPKEKLAELTEKIEQLKTSTPGFHSPMASAVTEESLYVVRAGKTAQDGSRLEYRPGPQDLELHIRGNPNRPGAVVPRRFLTVLTNTPRPVLKGSGRRELAEAIVTDAAALTARVFVNRIWAVHFGQGLVTTPSDFGHQGSRPSHPELLDDLAARFISGGWSLRSLHREIVLSATWRQSSSEDETKRSLDPSGIWLSRMNRRHLDFEAWRDAMLSVTGQLDLKMGGPSTEVDDAANRRRTLYATVHRREMSTTLQIHDIPDPGSHSAERSKTITALQSLYALNGPLLTTQSEALVNRLHSECSGDSERIERAYRLLFGRLPSDREAELGRNYLAATEGDQRRMAWKQYAHALLASNEFLFVD